MKTIIILITVVLLSPSCTEKNETVSKFRESINSPLQQDTLFQALERIIQGQIPSRILRDSIAFLVLPVEAACPSCRKKALDSIARHQNEIDEKHFVVISGTSEKSIRTYFREQDLEFPLERNGIYIDSTNKAFLEDLIFTKPVIYYAYNKKVYLKVSCVPITIKENLREFFNFVKG